MLEVMKETNEMLPNLLWWEGTGEVLTLDTDKTFFHTFQITNVSMIINLEYCNHI